MKVVLILVLSFDAVGQKTELKVLKPRQPIVCYQSNLTSAYHVGTPDNFRKNIAGRTKTANIVVEYINFPGDNLAKNALQHAIDIWETQLTSSVTIRIRAQWNVLGSGVLAQAIWGSAYANFNGAQAQNTYYPVALAEKIAGVDLNATTEPDIVATFNSLANWYLGTDGNSIPGKMDLITVALHEICHGLGFVDSFDADGGQGSVGLDGIPFIFDVSVVNLSKQSLVSDFISPSASLQVALTSDNIYFNSALATVDGKMPKLYAPSNFNSGSSVAHLDETTYKTPGEADNLMTPVLDMQESIHQPGPLTLGILKDLGWISTRIDHAALKDNERKDGNAYPVKATIVSDNGFKNSTVLLNYRTPATAIYTSIVMTPTGIPNEFQASLPGTTVNTSYAYYISVEDNLSRTFRNPGIAYATNKVPQQNFNVVNIGPDTEGPEIAHIPVDFVFDTDADVRIDATVTDNISVTSVTLEYQVHGGPTLTRPMIKTLGPDVYSATIDIPASLNVGDLIKYRIVAVDGSANANQSKVPSTSLFTMFVTGEIAPRNSYVNDFNSESFDFIGNSFSIQELYNFESGAIHSEHPYKNGSGSNDESNYIYQLQVPIIISPSNHYMVFDEIALVEPGEDGSKFGDDDFYDYVIVEGSKDNGLTWKAFEDGYDARAHTVWLSRYTNNIVNDDSQSPGLPFLFREQKIDMLESSGFKAGDVIKIRFRLFADQAAHGWGWAIDNLSIQGPLTGIEDVSGESLQVYPNPAKDRIVVRLPQVNTRVEIVDAAGRVYFKTSVAGETETEMDIHDFPLGVYIVKAIDGKSIVTRKFFKVGG